VSWEAEIGMMPVRLTSPTVGLRPTIPLTELGLTIDPSVSVPMPTAHSSAATAAPEVGPLAHVRLAEDHRPGLAELADDERVLRRLRPDEGERSGRRLHLVRGGEVVLDEDRNTV
jgi:hypothetical protein